MEASARRLGAAHLSFSSFALSQGLAVRKFVKPLGESTESATASHANFRGSCLSHFQVRMPCTLHCSVTRCALHFYCSCHADIHGRFRGPVWPLPSFWNFLAFADRVAVRTLLYSRGKDACGHVCACGLCAELPITVKGMG